MKIKKKVEKKTGSVILYARVKADTKTKLVRLAIKEGYGTRVGQLVDALVATVEQ